MNRQEKIEYYQRCIKAYKKRVPASANKQKIKWYEDAIKREEQIKMIKEIQMIKMRKDISCLQDNYGFTDSSLAKICGLALRTVREFMVMNRNLSDKNFHILNDSIKTIKEQIKEAEEYQPLHELLEKQIDSDWLQMQENILEKQND